MTHLKDYKNDVAVPLPFFFFLANGCKTVWNSFDAHLKRYLLSSQEA